MNELMFGPHSERHSSHNIIRERGASEFFTFTEIKVNFLYGEKGTSFECLILLCTTIFLCFSCIKI